MSQVRVEAAALPLISYAMAHNGISPIQTITLHNEGGAREGAEISVEVRDAQGVLSRAFTRRVDLAGDSIAQFADIRLMLAPEVMDEVEEDRWGAIHIVVSHAGEVLGELELSVQILAAHHWLSEPPGLGVELLAAHVMPNAPQITTLLPRVAELLRADTGESTIDGYQSGDPKKVDAIVDATFRVIQAADINYVEPPASWAQPGQKVRTPAEVIDGHLGTCLDTCVVLAAALEQAGIRAQVWLLEGHAILGYWRDEVTYPSAVSAETGEFINQIDLGRLALVETTMLTSPDANFDSASKAASSLVHGDPAKVQCVLDVYAARQARILPLPAVTRVGGTVQVVEYHPAAHSTAPAERVQPQPLASAPRAGQKPIPQRVSQWKNSLLDLGLRNRLINFSARSAVHLHIDPAIVHDMEDDLNNHRAITLRASDDFDATLKARHGIRTAADLPHEPLRELYQAQRAVFSDVPTTSYLSRLRSLAYKARTIQEETGANNLYLALGSLVWQLDGRQLRSPLVLIPVTLKAVARGGLYQFAIDEAGQSTPNYCLLEKLRQTFELEVPGLARPIQDASGIDLPAAFAALRQVLAANALPFHVEDTADISILQFAKFLLWKDVDEHWETLLQAPLVKHLALSPTQEFIDPVAPVQHHALEELATACPIPADGSQLTAIAEAIAGRTFVLEGPPGTGKSQTIANLLARAIAEGKRVLFVAEKRAALDVVRTRIDSIGLGAFALDLHDKLSKPAMVRQQIAHALDLVTRGDAEGLRANLDLVQSAGATLERYAKRLHEGNAAGLSLYSAETQRLALESTVTGHLPVPEHLVQPGQEKQIEQLRQLVRRLPEVADPAFPGPNAPWLFVRADSTRGVDLPAVARIASAIDNAARALAVDDALGRAVRAAVSAEELAALAELVRARLPLDLLDEVRDKPWGDATAQLRQTVVGFAASATPALGPATPAVLDLPLVEVHARAKAAAESSWFGRRKRQRAVIAEFTSALTPGVTLRPKELLEHVTTWLQVQEGMRQLATDVNAIPGIEVADHWNPLVDGAMDPVLARIGWLKRVSELVDPSRHSGRFGPALRQLFETGEPISDAESTAVTALADGLARLPGMVGSTANDLTSWAGSSGLVPRWLATGLRREVLDPNARSLERWITFRGYLEPLASAGMGDAYRLLLSGEVLSDAATVALERGIAAASLTERRRAQGLDAFDPSAHQRVVDRFVSASGEVRTLLKGTLPVSAIQRRTFAGDSLAGQVGRLKRELGRQRGGMSVRDLMTNFAALITEVMPCVLVSPDSVARFLSVGSQVFDLVVFDEASQIRVADAVGAIGRGRSVVVVGDSKQMPPSSFADVAWRPSQDDEEGADEFEETVEDEESILSECVQARVSRQWLTWHYRSHDESLIAFSNAHYYDGKLSSFPAPTLGEADPSINGHGINLVRVDGKFLRDGGGKLKRTNPEEAKAILAEIRKRFDSAPSGTAPSIGVVTFNQQQRAHIDALIRDSGDNRMIQALEASGQNGLFVKNLENVQGDERDVILFSTAFSVNDRGILPLNFGPLNKSGGERRLNVAITRARRQVILFSSFNPEQLRAEETSSLGIKHLRAYLDVAASATAALIQTVSRTLNVDRHRDVMAVALRARGMTVTPDVGLSDFRVDLQIASPTDAKQPVAAVLLDGPLWAKRLTVNDRDGMPVTVLESAMHWPVVERVWLPEWLENPEAVLDRIEGCVRGARRVAITQEVDVIEPTGENEAVPPSGKATEVAFREASVPARRAAGDVQDALATGPIASQPPSRRAAAIARPPTRARGFSPWRPPLVGYQEELNYLTYDQHVHAKMCEVLISGIKAEGPIHGERLAKLGAGAFGLQRVALSRINQVLEVAPGRPDSSGFYWPAGVNPTEWLEYRVDPAAQRPLEHISEVEVANAMSELCVESGGIDQEELWTETLRVFGYRRRTPAFVAALERGLLVAIQFGRVKKGSSGFYEGAL